MTNSSAFREVRGMHWQTFVLAALSLSIGWGIRGNFGHEYGAMIPGALTAIAVCAMSGRADWRERVAYFGMFGALGWAFGGSMSYMQVIAYTHSGDAASQYYGFFCLFVMGFLWGGMGGAGTAFPAVADRERLTAVFRPLSWVFGGWFLMNFVLVPQIEEWQSSYAATWSRHESLLYWFDADWLEAFFVVVSMCFFDLWERKAGDRHGILEIGIVFLTVAFAVWVNILPDPWSMYVMLGGLAVLTILVFIFYPLLAGYAAVGACGGWIIQTVLDWTSLSRLISQCLVQYQGDLSKVPAIAESQGESVQEVLSGFVTNWPQFFSVIPHHLGWILGILFCVALYFTRHGKFRSGSSLFLYMGVGWLVSFILFPTLLGWGGMGFRMTPPRGDDWAGILGVFAATLLWAYRQNLPGVVLASLVSAIVGGLGFSGAAFIKLMMVAPGNPNLVADPAVQEAWRHWQSANWHSFLEQTYGFINGLGIALAMGLLAKRQGQVQDEPRQRRWTEVYAVVFVLLIVTLLNVFKNVPEWTESKVVPAVMKMPLLGNIALPASVWFLLVWGLMSGMVIYLLSRHLKHPVAVVPESWLGKGQLFYLVFLWMMVVANFERALPRFSDGRILTEGTIFVNAILVTGMILLWPPAGVRVPEFGLFNYERSISRTLMAGVIAILLATAGMTAGVRYVYDGKYTGHGSLMKRFGPDATWRVAPLQKGQKHS